MTERGSLAAYCEAIDPPIGTRLYTEGQAVDYVYFPIRGVMSVFLRLAGGGTGEVLTVGNEGMLGLWAWLGVEHSLEDVVQQSPGMIVRIRVADFARVLAGSSRSHELIARFTAYSLRFRSQTAVCNGNHSTEQRTCRWLLSSADRARSLVLPLSQSLLAEMLGVRRQSVGEVAVALQRHGLIAYRRSDIRIVDRAGLEARTCECYRTLRSIYLRVMEPVLGEG